MRIMLAAAAVAVTMLAAPLSARQVPTIPPGLGQVPVEKPEILDPNPKKDHGCLRTDQAASAARMKSALDDARKTGGTPVEVDEVQKNVAGCTYYRVTLDSKMQIDDAEIPGVMSTISGRGSITFGLAPDDAMADYDFTSGVEDLTAPIYWTAGSADITKPKCEVTITPLPYTLFAFWLGVTSGPNFKLGVSITPSGNEFHPIETRCQDDLGRWSKRFPGKEVIFTPAWIKVHGEGKLKAPQTADQRALTQYSNELGKGKSPPPPKVSSPTGGGLDMGKLMAMANDPKKLADMQNLDPSNPADMAKLSQLMTGVVPNADAQLAAARDNFMFTVPGECRPVNVSKTVCTISRSAEPTKDRTGYGTIKNISEQTTITIEKVSAPPGSP